VNKRQRKKKEKQRAALEARFSAALEALIESAQFDASGLSSNSVALTLAWRTGTKRAVYRKRCARRINDV
jgi:hypothetical protein